MEQRRGAGRIGRLILLNAPAYPQEMRRGLAFLTLPVLPYVALGLVPPILTARAALETVNPTTPPVTDADAIAYADPLYSAAGRHALIATTRAIARYQASGAVPDYSRLGLPALLIWCRKDPTVPLSTGERLAREMPRARLSVLDHCDHSPAEEQVAETVHSMTRFLASRAW
jgi:pimeloyl-ACP methyl ester carboxylesterase